MKLHYEYNGIEMLTLVLVLLGGGGALGKTISDVHYQPQITQLKSELKVKNKQIDGLHKQLTRTQYQLKRSREQNVEQTQKISELTGNGG
ncbi:hypothetical protein [Streptococcus uberis]|uniref:hypothetical protein n=1 Tax=Streptococcus uberis TaxID=1349 RepID=UPI001FF0F83B|nr:hypothetical protein [Streptococcus uberis]MCK1226252.1 hypothetical protein [Streptococcus uberis]MCK1231833.1 hypothetical protein [Streptococcus uberis]